MAKAEGPEKYFRGKKGAFVYYQVKGITYVRKHVAKKLPKPPTSLQEYGWHKFRVANKFFKPLQIPLNFGFQSYLKGMTTGTNLACGWAIKNGFSGPIENSVLEPSLIKVSTGSLTGAESPRVSWTAQGKVKVEWEDNTHFGSARTDDQAMVVLYNVEDEAVFFVLEGNFRWEREQLVSVFRHERHVGKLEVYLSFSRPKNRGSKRDLSDSIYVGRV